MNRVVLCGRLEARPRLAYTGSGVPVALFQLLVPRERVLEPKRTPETIPCVAYGDHAENLNFWGEPGHRVNLEGQLRFDSYDVEGRKCTGVRVHSDHAYFVDPVTDQPNQGLRSPQHEPPLDLTNGRRRE